MDILCFSLFLILPVPSSVSSLRDLQQKGFLVLLSLLSSGLQMRWGTLAPCLVPGPHFGALMICILWLGWSSEMGGWDPARGHHLSIFDGLVCILGTPARGIGASYHVLVCLGWC